MKIVLKDISSILMASATAFALFSCNSESKEPKTDKAYIAEISNWQEERTASLTEEDSWLSLAGLYPLQQGSQSFGADSSHEIVFPPKAPPTIGKILRKDSVFKVKINPGVKVSRNGDPLSSITIRNSSGNETVMLKHDSFTWYIIERRGSYYLRLKDAQHANFSNFTGIESFPISVNWRIEAIFNRFEEPQTISIPDIQGEVYKDTLHGTLKFSVNGEKYSLAALGDPDKDDQFFLIFGDLTNGESTYGGGRYLYLDAPDEEGKTYIDFNKSYNPPCVFTNFATCPLPPAQNRLPLKVTAGEKMYDGK